MRVDPQLDDRRAQAALASIQGYARNPSPALKQISELVVDSTKQRFQTSRAPDGTPWEPNRPSTLFADLNRYSGSYRRDGQISARGSNRMMGKKPLIGETRALSTTINYRVSGNTAEIGSPMEYAPVHQFGARKGEFGSTRRGSPIPWGDIPARPFLGLSSEDSAMIRDVLLDFIVG